jgi:hypothetical protein
MENISILYIGLGPKFSFSLKPAQPAFLSLLPSRPSWRPSVWPAQDRLEAFVLTVPRQRPSLARVPPGKKNPPLTSSSTESATNQNRKCIGLESASFTSCWEKNPYIRKPPDWIFGSKPSPNPSFAPTHRPVTGGLPEPNCHHPNHL